MQNRLLGIKQKKNLPTPVLPTYRQNQRYRLLLESRYGFSISKVLTFEKYLSLIIKGGGVPTRSQFFAFLYCIEHYTANS